MAEGENAWTLSFLLHGKKILSQISPTQPPPAGTKPGNTNRMKKTDPALYAHVYSERASWDNSTLVWVLEIGRTTPGLPSHGSSMRVGLCSSAEDAVEVAIDRGVHPERVEVVALLRGGGSMRHSYRSPITGRFIAKRSTSADLVEEHNKATYKRRLWDLMDTLGIAVLFGMVGFLTVWTIAIVWGVVK